MKKILLLAVCSVFALGAKAQSITDEVGMLQSAYGMEKRQLITQYMKLNDTEAVNFWPAYDKYEAERKEIGKKRINVILEYSKGYTALTDAKATELIEASISNNMDFSKLMKKTFKGMSKTIGALRAAQFIQIENYLENMIRLEIADEIPFIGELDAAQKK